jgi:hypothetical protein
MDIYCVEDRKSDFVNIFFKSATSHSFSPKIIAPSTLKPASYIKFEEVYSHLSINSRAFELACFRRYFELAQLVRGSQRFIIADSDLLINGNPSNIPAIFHDTSNSIVGSIGQYNGIRETDISPHFSFWTPKLLKEFTEFIIFYYEHKFENLLNLHDSRLSSGNKRASISDMTLLNLFITETSVNFINSNLIINETYVDHNFAMPECVNASFKMQYGFKRFKRINNRLGLTTNGSDIIPLVLHLQGKAKIAARSINQGYDNNARLKLLLISIMKSIRNAI